MLAQTATYAAQPHKTHSQLMQLQASPSQSGQLQSTQFTQIATAASVSQHEPQSPVVQQVSQSVH
ncbi:MAG: hypothetical protein COA78_37975 [Blastopirellula sp.]|nr:MAG: hypothetical protein COA78_37975 [Blastopirellula sp.]